MEKISVTQRSRLLALYRDVLRWGVILLTEFFIILSLMQYAIPEREYLKHEKRLGAAILLAALIYVVIAACTDRDELRRIGGLIRRMCCFEQIMLILVLLWYILGCAVRSRLDAEPLFKFNDNRLFMFTMTVFAFYPFMTLMGRERAKRIFEGMIHFTMAIYTVFCAWCVWKYYRVEFLTFPSGLRLQNYREGVSMMIGGNINITAAAAVVMTGLCMYMILTQKPVIRILYIPAAIVHLMVMILTNSRTSYLAFLCMVVAAGFLFTWDTLQKSNYLVRFAAGLIAAALCAGAVYAARGSLIKMFSHVYPTYLEQQAQAAAEEAAAKQAAEEAAHELWMKEMAEKADTAEQTAESEPAVETAMAGETASETAAAEEPAPAEEAAAEPAAETAPAEEPAVEPAPAPIQTPYGDETARKMDDLNGRVSVWMTAIKIIRSSKDHFLFGVSPVYVKKQLEKVSGFDRSIPHAHNGILQVGVGIGAPAMLMFFLFEIAIIVRCLIIVFKGWGTPFRYSWIIPVILMGILIIDLVESMLFAMQRVNLPVFYILAGWTVSMTREINNTNKKR
ncbi:MAG: O-antigen ligase family protein [Lachnospiraceae bacterium]|nr:O-antigen ligase family protein [Lachnospiraceae bacterium]